MQVNPHQIPVTIRFGLIETLNPKESLASCSTERFLSLPESSAMTVASVVTATAKMES
jgi:hypothetical protein